MGLRMDDLHAPTVHSGPTTGQQANGANKDALTPLQLINEKERVEAEMKALGSVLDSVSSDSLCHSSDVDRI